MTASDRNPVPSPDDAAAQVREAESASRLVAVQGSASASAWLSGLAAASAMYLASLGSPERNPHLHLHVCPCPSGTPFDQQQFAAMEWKDGQYLQLTDERLDEIAGRIRNGLARAPT